MFVAFCAAELSTAICQQHLRPVHELVQPRVLRQPWLDEQAFGARIVATGNGFLRLAICSSASFSESCAVGSLLAPSSWRSESQMCVGSAVSAAERLAPHAPNSGTTTTSENNDLYIVKLSLTATLRGTEINTQNWANGINGQSNSCDRVGSPLFHRLFDSLLENAVVLACA